MANLLGAQDHRACAKSELVYDEPQLYQNDIAEDYMQFLAPKNTLTAGNPIFFDIEGQTDFLDLSQTQLKVTLLLKKGDDSNVVDATKVAPVNGVLHSLFQQVQVTLKDSLVTHSNNMYPYRAHIENLLTYSSAAKNNWMSTMGWVTDDAGKCDDEANTAFAKRKAPLKGGRLADYKGRLHIDLGFQEKILPSNLDVRITLTPTKPEFWLQSFDDGGTYKASIEAATLYVRRVKLTPTKQIAFEKDIAKRALRIPITYVTMKNVSIPSGVSSYNQDGLFTGPLPTLVVMGLVSNEAFVGDIGKSPYRFQHFNLNSLVLRVNGKSYPSRPLTPDYGTSNFLDCYQTLAQALGTQFDDFDNGITPDHYLDGCTLYAFNLTPDQCVHNNTLQTGSVDISMRFSGRLAETATLVVYSQFQNNVIIDQHRNCLTDVHS